MKRMLSTLVFVALGCCVAPVFAQEAITSATPDTIKHLRESAAKDRTFADEQQKRADAWHELARKARRNADETEDAANKASWLKDVEERTARAKEIEVEVMRLRAVADEKDARAARLDQAYNEQYGPNPTPALPPATTQPAAQLPEIPPAGAPTAQAAASETPEWMLIDLLGLWARTSEPGMTLALVPPGEEALPDNNRIEAYSDRYLWKGTFRSGTETEPARATLSYTPKPEEMNPEIPDWARQVVAGKLVWRLELEPQGDDLNPTLKAKWYRGEVRWGESGQTEAAVIGEGKPLEFDFEPLDAVQVESLSRPTLAIKLTTPEHDPETDPVEALTKGQRFFVRVTLPVEIARETGPQLSVTVRSLAGGGEETIELTGAMGKGQRPVVYSHTEPVTVADCDVFTELRRKPQFMSWNWVWGNTGQCLDIAVKNEELVEVRYGDAAQQVPIYDSWVQRGITRHVQGAVRLREIYQSILAGSYDRATKEAAHRRMRMLGNYDVLRGSEKLTDLHRFFVGEAYLGDIGPALMQTADAELQARFQEDVQSPQPRPDPEYFNPLVKAMLEGLTGKDLTPKAGTAGEAVVWTSEAEQHFVLREIRNTSVRLAEEGLKTTYENFSFGLYDGFASATRAGDLYLIVSGDDHFGRPQPRWVRVITAVGLASEVVLHLHGPTAASRFIERLGRRLPAVTGKLSQITLIARGARRVDRVDGAAGLPDVPKSVPAAQRRGLALELASEPPSKGGCACARRARAPAAPRSLRLPRSKLDDTLDLGDSLTDRAYVDRTWGRETEILDADKPPLMAKQSPDRPTCNGMAANRAVKKGRDVDVTEDAAQDAIDTILVGEFQAGQRTAHDILGQGFIEGFDNKVIRDYVRSHGGKVAEIHPSGNKNIKLRHIWSALEKNWIVKTVVNFGAGIHDFHAVIVEALVVNPKTRGVVAVRVYDSNVGRILNVPAKRFKELLNGRAVPKSYGILTLIRFDE